MSKTADKHVTQTQFKAAMNTIDQRFEQVDRRFDSLKDEVHFLGIKVEDIDSKMDTLLEICSPLLQKTTNHEERITKLEAIVPFK
jgi:chromosome segregation ATPase